MWLLAVIALVIALVVLGGLVTRFNQLSLARDLCDENRRQVDADIADRHLLLPAFLELCGKQIGMTYEVQALGDAFTAARQADTAEEIGRAEENLTVAVEELAETMRCHLQRDAERGQNPDPGQDTGVTARYLYVQIRVIEGRIASAIRYYNQNVERYLERRAQIFCVPFRAVFARYAPVPYSDLEFDPAVSSEQALETLSEDYRPGRLSEGP